MRFNPFPPVDCKRGAPMGRMNTRIAGDFPDGADLCARAAGEYDSGGAYWGTSMREGPVWAVWQRGKGSEGVLYIRARSKASAIKAAKGGE